MIYPYKYIIIIPTVVDKNYINQLKNITTDVGIDNN